MSYRAASWRELAVCRGEDIAVFFPAEPGARVYDTALTFCRRCPVSHECLQFALQFSDDQDRDGMFGGQTPHQRSRLRYRRMHNL